MRKVISVIFQIIAAILALITIIAMSVVLLMSSLHRTLLDPRAYQQAFRRNQVYERLPVAVAAEFSLVRELAAGPCAELVCAIHDTEFQSCIAQEISMEAINEILNGRRVPTATEEQSAGACLDGFVHASQPDELWNQGKLGTAGTALLKALSRDQWKELILYILPPVDVKETLDTTTSELISYFRGETDTVQVSLVIIKKRLTLHGDEVLSLLQVKSLPACTAAQEAQINAPEFGSGATPPIFCATTGETLQKLSVDLQRRLSETAAEIPDQAVLISPPSPSTPPALKSFMGENYQAALQKINENLPNSPLLIMTLLILITLFAVRSLRGWLRWWSIPVFIGSLLVLIVGAVIFFMFDWIWIRFVLPYLPAAMTSGFGEISRDVARSLSNDLAQQMMIQAGLFTFAALVILLISNRVPAPPDPSLPPLAPPGMPGGPVLSPQKKKKRW